VLRQHQAQAAHVGVVGRLVPRAVEEERQPLAGGVLGVGNCD
jgi:hypothetical protein